MDCELIGEINGFADLLVGPTMCDYYFWLKILGSVLIIIAGGFYVSQLKRTGIGNFIESISVSSITITMLAAIGTLIKNTQGIPMIQTDIFLYLLSFTTLFSSIWFFK